MAMVGLFWITEDSVYLGAEPVGTASGVRLTEDGVEPLGSGHGSSWSWAEVRRIEAADVAVRSGARRLASLAWDSVAVLVTGDGELPPAFTVRVETADGTEEVSVLSTAVGGVHTPDEYELSRTLLERITDSREVVGELLAWGRHHAAEGTPRREEREALLRKWAGAQLDL
ncbi:hypothetical protein [Streptomyces gilvus]|uniref:hypothetical protein n=1 Tax=Streptomyces gilvus TaxID=2920937 RepID=UPI001F0D55BB|nr:hypothetical protein [Streptomyces sp. CME 23]MCH5671337.1 hypothetical protein [Streptomyces sp. CME 23]